jgi:hypothetical protein
MWLRRNTDDYEDRVLEVADDPRPGDLVTREMGGDWLVLPDVLGGVRFELLAHNKMAVTDTSGGRQIETITNRRYLVTDADGEHQAVWRHGGNPVAVEPPAPSGRRGANPDRPWWHSGIPVTRATKPLLAAARVDDLAPWLPALVADGDLRSLVGRRDRLMEQIAGGELDNFPQTAALEQLPMLARMIDGRLAELRAEWIDANASDITLDAIATYRRMYEAAWWVTRDGTAGEVRLFAWQSRIVDEDVAGWSDPDAELEVMGRWLDEHGVERPVLPDIPARPRTLDEAIAAATTSVVV